jgi:deoxycytidylate deaminase
MLLLTKILAKQSTCNKRQVACIITKYGLPIAYGFNHGNKEQCGCSMDSKNPHVLHAEEMALSKPRDYKVHLHLFHWLVKEFVVWLTISIVSHFCYS